MTLVEQWRRDFDTDASVGTFFFSPAPEGLAKVTNLRRSVVDGVSCIDLTIGDELPGVSYTSDGNADAYDRMIADAGNRASGTIAYCYSASSARHGRYVKGASDWGARTGPTMAPLADDENHRRVTQIALMLQSYSAAGDAFAPPRFGYPDIRDLAGYVMRWRLRAIGMSMGRNTKIVQHFQTRIPGMPKIGTYTGEGQPYGAPAWVNAINRATCISDELGFGGGGLFAPNTVTYQADSGWIDVDIPLEPRWSYWLMMGGNDDKMGRLPYDRSLRYVVRNPADWVRAWTGNAYMLQAAFNPDPTADLPVVPASEAVRGRLLVQSVSFLKGQ